MKRVTIILICLIMCFSMAFPASAQTVITESNSVVSNAIIAADIQAKARNNSYIYKFITVTYSYALSTYTFVLYYSNTPDIIPSTVLFQYMISSSGTVTYVNQYRINSITYGEFKSGTNIYPVNINQYRYSTSTNEDTRLSGYLVNYSTALPSGLTTVVNNASVAGVDIEYFLSPKIDITTLESLLNTAKVKQNTGYTGVSWQALQTAITAADNLLATTGYTQAQIDESKSNLQTALDGLTLLPDTSALRALLNQAKAVTNNGYNSTTWQALQSAITSAQTLLNETDYTVAQVESARSNLQSALNSLEYLPPVDELKELLVEADQIDDIGYTAPTWTRFDNARTAGHALVASTNYTTYQMQTTTTELRVSMNGLTLATASEIPEPNPVPKGYDLDTGEVSGYLSVVPKLFFNYVKSPIPIGIGIFAIVFSIKVVPHLLGIVISRLRR